MGELFTGKAVFQGDSDIDQLYGSLLDTCGACTRSPLSARSYIIQKEIGPLTPAQLDLFSTKSTFANLRFPNNHARPGLHPRFGRKLHPDALNLMEVLLLFIYR